jgi:hypothetical protein
MADDRLRLAIAAAEGSRGSEWVRLSPPRPAISSFRDGEGIASCTTTPWPAAARRSAAIRPAGPAPTIWTM